jgi:putative FmdB family regulatory protein
MPLYEFVCRDCDKPFEVLHTLANFDRSKVACPGCGGQNIDRIWSSVYAVTSKKS